jgi:mannobiose 2-epimerase
MLKMKLLLLSCVVYFSSSSFAQTTNRDSILMQMKYAAKKELLDKYYPRNIDSLCGGYLSTFTYDFQPQGEQDKMIVTQARHVWTTAKAAMFYKDSTYISMSRHGFLFLRDKMWDKEYGGFYNLVTRQGKPKTMVKQAYGNGFGIYALAAFYECTYDTAALNLAKKAFMWLEDRNHDRKWGGYYQYMQRDGTPILRTPEMPGTMDTGYKDQNSSIHLLEAFTELYRVWPDPLLRKRLEEMLLLIRDKIVTQKGYLQLYFTPEWKAVSYRDSSEAVIKKNHYIDHVSFGHDVETAYLMLEASEALGNRHDKKTMATGKRMVDHALKNGWDNELGGFYDEGYYFKNKSTITITVESKNWWAQAEGLNTLLLLSDEYPDDPKHYYQHFIKLWQYVQTYLIDHEQGDWYEEGLDKEPQRKTALKAQIWKGAYHNFRALMNCINRIEWDKKPG